MTTPVYKMPELIPGSLQMTAYNDRLRILESLYGLIPVKGIYDAHVLADFTPNYVHIVSNNPTNSNNNWYRTKANHYHLNVDSTVKFIEPNLAKNLKVKYLEAIGFNDTFTFDDYSLQEIPLAVTDTITYLNLSSKFNFVNATQSNTQLTLIKSAIDIQGIAYVVNSGTTSCRLCLNTDNSCSTLAVGQKVKIVSVNNLLAIS